MIMIIFYLNDSAECHLKFISKENDCTAPCM